MRDHSRLSLLLGQGQPQGSFYPCVNYFNFRVPCSDIIKSFKMAKTKQQTKHGPF